MKALFCVKGCEVYANPHLVVEIKQEYKNSWLQYNYIASDTCLSIIVIVVHVKLL